VKFNFTCGLSGGFTLAWFRCFIRGENFPGSLAGGDGLIGFYTTRFVEASDPALAEAEALGLLRADSRLAKPPGYETKGIARVIFEEIAELPATSFPRQQPGFVWYPMDADS
jgi:hypothetical protein